MDPLTVAICTLACFILYNVIKVAVKLLKMGPFSDYASKSDGPQSMPIIGLAYLFIGGAEATMKNIIEMGKTYPPSFQTSLGKFSIFATGIPGQLKAVLLSSKTIEKNEFYDFGRPWLGNGIFTAPASIWEVHRKLIQPSFNSIVLKSFIEIFSAQSFILVKKMERHLDGPEFEIHEYLSLCTLDVICGTAMGINLEAQTKENCHYGKAAHAVIAGVTKRVLSPWLYPDFIFNRTRLGKDQEKNIKFLHGFVDNVIREKKERISQRTSQRELAKNGQNAADSSSTDPEVLIDNLIKLSTHNQILTDETVREQVDTIMVAGSDTTSIVGSFVILMLASQPGVQEKAYQELCDIFGGDAAYDDSGEPPVTSEVLRRMTYMERVIKETMRLFPIGPLLFRKATDDLDLGNCTVPKGSTVALNIIGVHRNEKYWPDPYKFDPDRFLPERFAEQEPFSYLPFSGGPRNCIGSKYAMMFIKTFTAMILRRYVLAVDKVIPVEDVRLKMEFMMTPAVPIAIRIKKRTQEHKFS
ncbi:cytochrome P450 4C1-like [Diprion similis]|uniref:cytochrome P450 4C1-like n=1 Tax=Diprion similis TaxID=362088 RepID=UPI001EF8A368|nr:cytochrome P450 4C1-like [Diprion similis]